MTENNDFNNTENERYCVRAGYWHNYTGIGRCEDENLTTNEVCDLINEQHETIQRLQAQLSHLEYRFFEYRNKAKGLPKDKVKETLQKRYNHLQKTQQETEKPPRYWQGAIMEIEVIADCLGVELK